MATVAALVVVLTGCMPLHYDADTGKSTSHAEWRVAAVNTSKGPGIEIRIRHCDTVVISASSLEDDLSVQLRPVATVTDSAGKVLFSNWSAASAVIPVGSKVIESTDSDDLQRIIIPTSAAKGALTITPSCTSYPGYGSGSAYSWDFQPCTTTTRSCATRKAGTGTFRS
jgi:hypothetical protein